MLVIVAKNVLLEGKREEFLKLAGELVEKSREEAGCLGYNLYEDTKDSNVVAFVEQWKDQQAIATHNATEHFTRICPQLRPYTQPDQGELHIYRPLF